MIWRFWRCCDHGGLCHYRRLGPGAIHKQLAAVTLGMGIYGTLVWLLGRLHLAVKLRWPVAAAAAALLAFNVVMGERIFGARTGYRWAPFPSSRRRLVKLAFILAGPPPWTGSLPSGT
ncbi:MAG: hypothetical protein ACLSHM_01320 [Vescimonas sp.]